MARDPVDHATLDALALSANPSGSAVAHQEVEDLRLENQRLRAGLSLIVEAGMAHGPAWCVAQARGFLLDLDFDGYPETGRPETEPPAP